MKAQRQPRQKARLQRQRRNLATWLHEWQIDQALLKADESPGATAMDTMRPQPLGWPTPPLLAETSAPTPGQIRLLMPLAQPSGTDRPLYVMVLGEDQPGAYTCAPFSRFSHPAVPGEWLTGLRAAPLRVLCLWNRRILTRDILCRSWLASAVPASWLREIPAMNADATEPAGPASDIDRKTGPPLLHPSDPRHRYLAEEAEAFEEVIQALTASVSKAGPTDRRFFAYEDSRDNLRLAAETRGTYSTKRKPRQGKPRGASGH